MTFLVFSNIYRIRKPAVIMLIMLILILLHQQCQCILWIVRCFFFTTSCEYRNITDRCMNPFIYWMVVLAIFLNTGWSQWELYTVKIWVVTSLRYILLSQCSLESKTLENPLRKRLTLTASKTSPHTIHGCTGKTTNLYTRTTVSKNLLSV